MYDDGWPKYKLRKRLVDGLWDLFVLVKYPKIILLLIVAFLAYGLFKDDSVQSFFHALGGLGYLSAFIGGMLFAFGFGAPFGVAILATIANDLNILLAGIVGGVGALASDYLLFRFIRVTFLDEIERLKGSKAFRLMDGLMKRRVPPKIALYVSAGVAGFIIASPLPDEIGVTLLAGLTKMETKIFAIMAFTLNTAGILAVLAIGSVI
jgi:uncharacterized membrane protein YdjX (TVP38/TMEM64 family)